MALTEKLAAIGDAIRAKNGETEKYTLDGMVTAIGAIETGGGGGGADVEPVVLTGACDYACSGNIASTYMKNFGDKVSTNNITGAASMFLNSTLDRIPFELNFSATGNSSMANMFQNCEQLTEVPKINNVKPSSLNLLFCGCKRLRYLPEDLGDSWDWSYIQSYNYGYMANMFDDCFSLRKIPQSFLSNLWGVQTSSTYCPYKYIFSTCYALDEVKGLPIQKAKLTSNLFISSFESCCRLKSLTFATNEDGTAQTAEWKSQTIDLTSYIGFITSFYVDNILNYNSGITADKEVKDDATYQALKNDADWFTKKIEYSRYNHDSAVNTINSLPDTSAYLASAGGTNTIKFKGASGSLTDGGAINTLTDTEIAVAAAKGWTVTFA